MQMFFSSVLLVTMLKYNTTAIIKKYFPLLNSALYYSFIILIGLTLWQRNCWRMCLTVVFCATPASYIGCFSVLYDYQINISHLMQPKIYDAVRTVRTIEISGNCAMRKVCNICREKFFVYN